MVLILHRGAYRTIQAVYEKALKVNPAVLYLFSFLMTIMPNKTYQNMFVTVAALQTASMSGCEGTCFMHPNHQ